MSTPIQPQNQSQTPAPVGEATAPARKRRHLFRWFFLAVQVLFLVWIIAGANSSSGSVAKSCAGMTGQALQTCTDAGHVGTGIGVMLIIVLWAVVDVILGISFLVMRATRRR